MISLAFPKSRIKIGQAGTFDFLEKPRPDIELTSSIKREYTIRKDLTVYCQWVPRRQPMDLPIEKCFSRLLVFPVL